MVREQFFIYMDKTEHSEYHGWFLNPYVQKYTEFSSLEDLILKIDKTLKEQADMPDSEKVYYHSLRTLPSKKQLPYFFLLEILFTEHSSWQGQLTGTGCPKTCFKSVLELIEKLVQSMECGKKPKNGRERPEKWKVKI